ncbi:unnamed protein product, partial [Mesorhabditis spiculigera]
MPFGDYNMKSPGVRRLMKEASELRDPTEYFAAYPMEENLFEWHFTVRGPRDTDFDGGIYHGRIVFPDDYPMKPPNIMFFTPNGRWELNKKVCLSISGYHPETWLPSWSIRTALHALVGFMATDSGGAIGALDYPPAERKRLAKASETWKCKECGACMKDALLPLTEASEAIEGEAKELAKQLQFRDESAVKAEVAASSQASAPVENNVSPKKEGSADEDKENKAPVVSSPEKKQPEQQDVRPTVEETTPEDPKMTPKTEKPGTSTSTGEPTLRRRTAGLRSPLPSAQRQNTSDVVAETESSPWTVLMMIPVFLALCVVGLVLTARLYFK